MKTLALAALMLGWTAQAAGPMAVSVGDPALLFTLQALNEDAAVASAGSAQISLGDFVGVQPARPRGGVLVYFFDESTPQSATSLAVLERLNKRYSGKRLQVLGVTSDDMDLGSLSTWIGDQKLSFPVLRDNHRVVGDRYGVSRQPLALLIDREGRVFAIGNPDSAALEGELESELAALLKD